MMKSAPNLLAAQDFDLSPWVRDEAGPGVIAAVLSGNEATSWASAGRATVGSHADHLKPKTVFYVASVSKQFSAACVTACEADALIDVDASICGHLPELPVLFEPITLRHLLHHLGGLAHGGAAGVAAAPKKLGD